MKLIQALLEQEKILVPRRSKEERAKNHLVVTQKKIQQYIKDGSKGDLNLSSTPITSLPDNLKYVGGDLNLIGSKIISLPDDLEVKGHLDLSYTSITSLPNNLKVGNSLHLDYSEIKSLQDNLKVGRGLWILDTPLEDKYSDEEIRNLANIKGTIYR